MPSDLPGGDAAAPDGYLPSADPEWAREDRREQIRRNNEQFACICPDPPVAVEGCPAHVFRYAFQEKAKELWPTDDQEGDHDGR
jgi:hypothetical protein